MGLLQEARHPEHPDPHRLGVVGHEVVVVGGGSGVWAVRMGEAKASKRDRSARAGCTYLHTAIDGFSRLAYAEALDG